MNKSLRIYSLFIKTIIKMLLGDIHQSSYFKASLTFGAILSP